MISTFLLSFFKEFKPKKKLIEFFVLINFRKAHFNFLSQFLRFLGKKGE